MIQIGDTIKVKIEDKANEYFVVSFEPSPNEIFYGVLLKKAEQPAINTSDKDYNIPIRSESYLFDHTYSNRKVDNIENYTKIKLKLRDFKPLTRINLKSESNEIRSRSPQNKHYKNHLVKKTKLANQSQNKSTLKYENVLMRPKPLTNGRSNDEPNLKDFKITLNKLNLSTIPNHL